MTARDLYSKILLLSRRNTNIKDEFYVLLNSAIRKVASDLEMWYSERTTTSDIDYKYYLLPSDLMELISVYYDGKPIDRFTYTSNKEDFGTTTVITDFYGLSSANTPTYSLTWENNQPLLHIQPIESDKTIEIIYKSVPTSVTAQMQDKALPLPVVAHDLIDFYLQYLVYDYLRDVRSTNSLLLYEKALKEINLKHGGIERVEKRPAEQDVFLDREP